MNMCVANLFFLLLRIGATRTFDALARTKKFYFIILKPYFMTDESEVDLKCLEAVDCTKEPGCAYSKWYQQCVPEDIYRDIGRVRNGPKAQSYFRQVPQEVLGKHGQESLTTYCEMQSSRTCYAPCTHGWSGCTTEDRQFEPLKKEKVDSLLRRIFKVTVTNSRFDFSTRHTIEKLSSYCWLFILHMKIYSYTSNDFLGAMYRTLISANVSLKDIFGDDFSNMISAPILEEVVFRGSLLLSDEVIHKLMDKIDEKLQLDPQRKRATLEVLHLITLLAQATLFGLAHINNVWSYRESAVYVATAFWSAIVWGSLARKHGLKSSILSHMLNNTISETTKKSKTVAMLSGIAHMMLRMKWIPNSATTNKYHVLLQHSQRFMPIPTQSVMNEAGPSDILDDSADSLEDINATELEAIAEFETESRLDWICDALMNMEIK